MSTGRAPYFGRYQNDALFSPQVLSHSSLSTLQKWLISNLYMRCPASSSGLFRVCFFHNPSTHARLLSSGESFISLVHKCLQPQDSTQIPSGPSSRVLRSCFHPIISLRSESNFFWLTTRILPLPPWTTLSSPLRPLRARCHVRIMQHV